MAIVLASASPRRADLLRAAGFAFEVRPVDVDEQPFPDEPPEGYVLRVAGAKADAAVAQWPDDAIVAADTTVVLQGVVFGKPVDAADATRMLRRLSGQAHDVLTGVVVVTPARREAFVDVTRVWFSPLSDADIAWYVGSGEPMDKAGAYAVQGLASRFIPRIEGAYANVVGLPVARLSDLLRDLAGGG
jgi:septum formation protein